MLNRQSIELSKTGISGTIQIWVVLLLTFALSTSAFAEIYKWVDSNGKTHFTDNPPEQATVTKLDLQINSYTTENASAYKFDSSLISKRRSNHDVIMYSASWCGVCKTAKKYFKKNNIKYTEYDIEKSAKGKKDFKKINGKGVPVILVGNNRMNGFSAAGFDRMYNPQRL